MAIKMKSTALVISGGGSKGAFAVGVLKYLFQKHKKGEWFSIVGGTSTGALIAPLAAMMGCPDSRGAEALDTLVDLYSNVSTPDILEKQSIFELIQRQDCLYESDPLKDLMYQHFNADWFDWLQSDEAPYCYVVYTNYQDGNKVTVSPKDPDIGRNRFMKAMLASASVPVVMEATTIDDDVCYDGGVRDLVPFARAIRLGAEVIIPVFLDPEVFPKTHSRFRRLDKVLLRTLSILVDEAGRNDFEMANLINIGISAKGELLEAFKHDRGVVRKISQILSQNKYQSLFGPEKRVVKIVAGLRPDQPLTENSLVFEPAQMRRWIRWGEKKAEEILPENPFEEAPLALDTGMEDRMKDRQMEQIIEDLRDLDENQLFAGLAVVSKDLARYLESNPRMDAELFNAAYTGFSAEERTSWGGGPFFDPPGAHGIPSTIAEQAARGAFDLHALRDPGIVHEWTVHPGRRLLERFGRQFKKTICGPGGPYEQFEKGLVGQAQLPATIAASILAAGISVATLWYPLVVYIALLLIKTGLAAYCRTNDT